jgi:hypothetical protein
MSSDTVNEITMSPDEITEITKKFGRGHLEAPKVKIMFDSDGFRLIRIYALQEDADDWKYYEICYVLISPRFNCSIKFLTDSHFENRRVIERSSVIIFPEENEPGGGSFNFNIDGIFSFESNSFSIDIQVPVGLVEEMIQEQKLF